MIHKIWFVFQFYFLSILFMSISVNTCIYIFNNIVTKTQLSTLFFFIFLIFFSFLQWRVSLMDRTMTHIALHLHGQLRHQNIYNKYIYIYILYLKKGKRENIAQKEKMVLKLLTSKFICISIFLLSNINVTPIISTAITHHNIYSFVEP